MNYSEEDFKRVVPDSLFFCVKNFNIWKHFLSIKNTGFENKVEKGKSEEKVDDNLNNDNQCLHLTDENQWFFSA